MKIPYEPKSIHFATMANIHPKFLNIVKKTGMGVFVNSPLHLKTVIDLGFNNSSIVFTASAISKEAMMLASQSKVLSFLDSPLQLEQWQGLFQNKSVGIRCNINNGIKPIKTHASYFIGNEKSKYGISK